MFIWSRALFRRYNNKKRKHIDGFFVVCATSKERGLTYDILLDSLGAEKRFPGCPRLGVVIDDYVVPVSISSNPVVLSESSFRDSDKILDWVKKNKTSLLMHWNKQLTDLDILEAICLDDLLDYKSL